MGTACAVTMESADSRISLNPDQELAVRLIIDFIADPDPASPFFVLKGYAGTGKTFIMKEVLARCARTYSRFAFTTPTNKATKVLRSATGSASTIYSLLGLRIEKNGELKTLVGGEKPQDLSDLDVIFLDEASMVNQRLFSILHDAAKGHNLKIIFMGDAGQLPPVGEVASPVWGIEQGAALSKVMRHDNQILQLVTDIRSVMNDFSPSISIKSDNDGKEGVWKLAKAAFKESIYNAALKGEFADGSKGKVIAWRNERVSEYNDLIRRAIFGAASIPGHYVLGDRIVATSPCKQGEDYVLGTDDEAIIEGVAETTHYKEPKYRALELKCRTEDNRLIRLLVLHPDSKFLFDNDCQELAHAAKGAPRLWKLFWNLKELFHEVKYAYAITAHRSQGSTYETVYVDYVDILYNRNRKEAFQCLYVACSRPTKKLVLA